MPRPADLQEPELSPAMQRVVAAMSISIAAHLALIGLLRVNPVAAPVAAAIPVIEARLQPAAPPPIPAPPKMAVPATAPETAPEPAPEAPPQPAPPAPEERASPPAPAASDAPPVVPRAPNPAPQPSSALPAVNVPLLVDPTYYTAKQLDVQPRALAAISPVYPPDAVARGTAGWVVLKLKLDEGGNVQDVEVSDASPPGIFDQSARDAFRNARFAPAQKDGRAVKSLVQIKVRYELDR
ncbi:proline-rich protein [Sulfuriferula multivorans]|uniref:Protein TonB n=1 Tax=Sulfuriferula multivorans TaxID=1559896 RepID=A0A401JDW1_9PROT|nr:energy transducer TonB [Sulfuriferula multivorans]GBL45858.1 proline-rich protein [Sulfuriferula multivorans]